jgi:hypothetical protein
MARRWQPSQREEVKVDREKVTLFPIDNHQTSKNNLTSVVLCFNRYVHYYYEYLQKLVNIIRMSLIVSLRAASASVG